MSRYIYQGHFKDQSGNVVASGRVTVYEAGVNTLANVYEADSGGTAVNYVTSDSYGYFKFYVDTTDYSATKRFDIVLTKSGFQSQTYEDVVIYPAPDDDTFVTFPAHTGVSSTEVGLSARFTYKITVAKEAWTAAALTESISIFTVPEMTRIHAIVSDTTEAYVLGASNITLEISSTLADVFIADHDVSSATVRKDVDNGGFIINYTADGTIQVTLTSSVGNLGDGATTSLTAGSTDVYVTVEKIA